MTTAEIIQIVIGVLSLIATVAVSFAIYWLQSRHEKEMEKLAKENDRKLLHDAADRFLIDNAEERDYLPLCVFATNLHKHKSHVRSIYTNFCRCNGDLQNEILATAGFSCRTIENNDWLNKAVKKLKLDIKEKGLGTDYLYDGAKYFHRAFERYKEKEWDYSYRQEFEPIAQSRITRMFSDNGLVSISSYVDDYFYYQIEKHDGENIKENPIPPIDYLFEMQNLGTADEDEVCGWLMEIIDVIAIIIHNKTIDRDNDLYFEDLTDAQSETFEDKYYETVRTLYYTYCV